MSSCHLVILSSCHRVFDFRSPVRPFVSELPYLTLLSLSLENRHGTGGNRELAAGGGRVRLQRPLVRGALVHHADGRGHLRLRLRCLGGAPRHHNGLVPHTRGIYCSTA